MAQPPPRSRIPPPTSFTLRSRSSTSSLSGSTSSSRIAAPATPSTAKPRPPPLTVSKPAAASKSGATATGPAKTTLRTVASQPRLNGSGSTLSSTAAGRTSTPSTPTKSRTRPPPKSHAVPSSARKVAAAVFEEEMEKPTKPALSLKEQIALRRAEAKKAATKMTPSNVDEAHLDDETWNGGRGHTADVSVEEESFGRWGIKEGIERSRTSGNLNISSRDLSHLPTALFTIQLGLTPERLPSQLDELPEDPKSLEAKTSLAYYEVVDLTLLKARGNHIVALQPELSLFGSLKFLDLHGNKLKGIPRTLADLGNLTTLDLSNNLLDSIPGEALRGMISLVHLDLSGNVITELDFGNNEEPTSAFATSFFEEPQRKAVQSVLPSLQSFSIAQNKIRVLPSATFPPGALPSGLIKIDLSNNPLGKPIPLIESLERLPKLKELALRKSELESGTFQTPSTQTAEQKPRFSSLKKLDVSENEWISQAEVKSYLEVACRAKATFSLDESSDAVHVVWGEKDCREAWEIEAESRGRGKNKTLPAKSNIGIETRDDDSGLPIGQDIGNITSNHSHHAVAPKPEADSVTEEWALGGEESLRTEAGRLRKRLADLEIAKQNEEQEQKDTQPSTATALNRFYDSRLSTLTLPAAKPPIRGRTNGHGRGVSLTFAKSSGGAFGFTASSSSKPEALNAPSETLPLAMILSHDWCTNIKTLVLSNRRADVIFDLGASALILDQVEELHVDGCQLGDDIRIRRGEVKSDAKEPLFSTIQTLFPSLTLLDLSDNVITKLPSDLLKSFFPEGGRGRGLKTLRARGNRINDLEGLVEVAERFGRGESTGWQGEEVDIRDNDVNKLPPVLGLLQLDVFLVEGNSFRVPHRSVWQKEGTRGLLRWLKDSG